MRLATGWMEEKEEVTRAERDRWRVSHLRFSHVTADAPIRVRSTDSSLLVVSRQSRGNFLSQRMRGNDVENRRECPVGPLATLFLSFLSLPPSLFPFFFYLRVTRSFSPLLPIRLFHPPFLSYNFFPSDDFYFHPRDPHSLTMKIARLFAIDHYPVWSRLRPHSRECIGKATRFSISSLPLVRLCYIIFNVPRKSGKI